MPRARSLAAVCAVALAAGLAAAPAQAHRRPAAPAAAAALSPEAAADLARRAVARHRLTRLAPACLAFEPAADGKGRYAVTVREVHNAACGGDPQTAPRLFTLSVGRQAVYLDDDETG